MSNTLRKSESRTWRCATKNEIEHAAMALRSVNEAVVDYVLSDHAMRFGNDIAIVVTDFRDVPESAQVLLVPAGRYDLPAGLLERVQYIVGLGVERADYPVLNLLAEPASVINADNEETVNLCVATCLTNFIGVSLTAERPTVLESYIGGNGQFSKAYFNVQWQHNVDAYSLATCVAYNGWDWMFAAYGKSMCRRRNILEKTMDAAHEGVMNTIDGISRALACLAEKVDRVLGLK